MDKRKKLVCLLCLIFLIVTVSCSLFEIEEKERKSDSSVVYDNGYVNVKFCLQKPKSLGMSYPVGSEERYQYMATAQSQGNVKGDKSTWTDFENNTTVGEFSKGLWKFDFRVLYGTEQSYGIISTGSENVMVTGTDCKVSSTLKNHVSKTGTGSMLFSVGVKAVSENNGELLIYYGDDLLSPSDFTVTRTGTDILFSGRVDSNPGFYYLRFKFYDETVEKAALSSEMLSIRIVENAAVAVTGNLASATYAGSSFTITYPKINATMTCSSQSITKNNEVTFTCSAQGGASYNYIWYVNGNHVVEQTANTLDYTFTNGGIYNVSCIVWCMDGTEKIFGSISKDVQVN